LANTCGYINEQVLPFRLLSFTRNLKTYICLIFRLISRPTEAKKIPSLKTHRRKLLRTPWKTSTNDSRHAS